MKRRTVCQWLSGIPFVLTGHWLIQTKGFDHEAYSALLGSVELRSMEGLIALLILQKMLDDYLDKKLSRSQNNHASEWITDKELFLDEANFSEMGISPAIFAANLLLYFLLWSSVSVFLAAITIAILYGR